MTIHDMNFDGYDDLDLFGWSPNNTIPHYYWLWDQETQRYQFAFILQGAEADPESQEIRATAKSFGGDGPEGGFYQTNIYRYVDFGELALVRREVTQIRGGKMCIRDRALWREDQCRHQSHRSAGQSRAEMPPAGA